MSTFEHHDHVKGRIYLEEICIMKKNCFNTPQTFRAHIQYVLHQKYIASKILTFSPTTFSASPPSIIFFSVFSLLCACLANLAVP